MFSQLLGLVIVLVRDQYWRTRSSKTQVHAQQLHQVGVPSDQAHISRRTVGSWRNRYFEEDGRE
jgi:hypothetical protein